MTVSANQRFDTVSSAGSGLNWNDLGNLDYGSTGEAYWGPTTLWTNNCRTLIASKPHGISGIGDGAEFVSLKLTFQARIETAYGASMTTYFNGGTEFDETLTSSYQTFTYEGDKDYFGFSGDVYDIFTDLRDGSLYVNVDMTAAGFAGELGYLKDMKAEITYRDPDTSRASFLITIP